MGLSEVINIVVAICTVLLTIFAGIGLFTWKHQNRFEEKRKTLNEIFKLTNKLCYRLRKSLIHISMIHEYIKKASNSNVGLDETSLMDAIGRFAYVAGENDTIEFSLKKNGLVWAEELRIEIEGVDEVLSDLEFFKLNARAVELESINDIENNFNFFVNFTYMFLNINCLMTLPRTEFQSQDGINLIEHFSGLDHKKLNQELAEAGVKCRDFVKKELKRLYG